LAEEHYDELAIKKGTGVEHIPSTKELLKSVICEHDEVILAYLYGSAVQTCSKSVLISVNRCLKNLEK